MPLPCPGLLQIYWHIHLARSWRSSASPSTFVNRTIVIVPRQNPSISPTYIHTYIRLTRLVWTDLYTTIHIACYAHITNHSRTRIPNRRLTMDKGSLEILGQIRLRLIIRMPFHWLSSSCLSKLRRWDESFRLFEWFPSNSKNNHNDQDKTYLPH